MLQISQEKAQAWLAQSKWAEWELRKLAV